MRSNIDNKFSNIIHAQQHIDAAKVFKIKPGLGKNHNYCGCQACTEKTGFDSFIRKAGHSNRVTMRVIKRRARKMRRLNNSIMTRKPVEGVSGKMTLQDAILTSDELAAKMLYMTFVVLDGQGRERYDTNPGNWKPAR